MYTGTHYLYFEVMLTTFFTAVHDSYRSSTVVFYRMMANVFIGASRTFLRALPSVRCSNG